MGRITSYDQDGRIVADFDKSAYDLTASSRLVDMGGVEMTDTQQGKPANESRPPAWAKCGNCRWCQRYDEAARLLAIYDPFFFLRDAELGNRLRRSCGICAERDNDPVVVDLDTREGDMPCRGFGWGLAGDGPQEPS